MRIKNYVLNSIDSRFSVLKYTPSEIGDKKIEKKYQNSRVDIKTLNNQIIG